MNPNDIKTGFQKLKPVINAAIVIGSVFAFLYVGKHLLNFAADFVTACRNVKSAFSAA